MLEYFKSYKVIVITHLSALILGGVIAYFVFTHTDYSNIEEKELIQAKIKGEIKEAKEDLKPVDDLKDALSSKDLELEYQDKKIQALINENNRLKNEKISNIPNLSNDDKSKFVTEWVKTNGSLLNTEISTELISEQSGEKETGVYLNTEMTNQLISGLINCDYNQKENEILTNSLQEYENIAKYYRELTKESIIEIEKRDDIIEKQDLVIEQSEVIISDLKKALQKEVKRKKANKWIYLGAGVVGGFFVYKNLR